MIKLLLSAYSALAVLSAYPSFDYPLMNLGEPSKKNYKSKHFSNRKGKRNLSLKSRGNRRKSKKAL